MRATQGRKIRLLRLWRVAARRTTPPPVQKVIRDASLVSVQGCTLQFQSSTLVQLPPKWPLQTSLPVVPLVHHGTLLACTAAQRHTDSARTTTPSLWCWRPCTVGGRPLLHARPVATATMAAAAGGGAEAPQCL